MVQFRHSVKSSFFLVAVIASASVGAADIWCGRVLGRLDILVR